MNSSFVHSLAEQLQSIRTTLPETVRLIAVTKQVPVEVMRTAYELGLRDFGENRIQEASAKQVQLQDLPDITWHMIGHLQTNKAAKALELFDWIHSLDSLKLAQRLDQLADEQNIRPKLCLQVKIVPDPAKSGWTVPDLLAALPELDQCAHLDIRGLMTIPPYGLPVAEIQSVFEQTRLLAQQIQQQPFQHLTMQELSMGMSDDYPLAIAAGATMIRLGRTLFGART
jgi:PLP dependent protein